MNESYILKTSGVSYSTPVASMLDPASEPAIPRSPWDTVNDRTLDDIRCQHMYCPIWCKQLCSGSWDGNTKIHLFLVLLLFYLYKCLLTAYCVPGTLLGIQLRMLFLYPVGLSSLHKSQWYHCLIFAEPLVVLGTVVVIYPMSPNIVIILQGRSWCSHFITGRIESERLVIFSE